MELSRIIYYILRVLQVASGTIVAGITGFFLYQSNASTWDLGRFIYIEAAASLSLLIAILFLLPYTDAFIQIPFDIIVSLLWWVTFGLLFNFLGFPCEWVFEWMDVSPFDQQCGKLKADVAFSFTAAIVWMASAIVNILILRREGRQEDTDVTNHYRQREMRRNPSVV
ncbi:membrane-associating domain protein [Metarhizium robertsii]|uniref:Integral membrane protein n=2 Tax=Metarhizium robertsii TaxID=568076 RepID=E9F1U1_METRA|nr:uncharacterized protein MAA_06139 [Metarhizium robertsii ARSEF 23]EFY98030.1 integral membrane protein [Metarhizium robertsii ARSEF 23]EXU97805.1 membrane-associating domain protein [Metarhizium robertsii]